MKGLVKVETYGNEEPEHVDSSADGWRSQCPPKLAGSIPLPDPSLWIVEIEKGSI